MSSSMRIRRCAGYVASVLALLTFMMLLTFMTVAQEPQRDQSKIIRVQKPKPATESKGESPRPESGAARKPTGDTASDVPLDSVEDLARKKTQSAKTLLEDILITNHRIDPVEWSILIQVEAATLLWDLDRDLARSYLLKSFDRLRTLIRGSTDAKAAPPRAELENLKAAILRNVARVDRDLLREFAGLRETERRDEVAILGEWTQEAQALVTVADEEIEQNPTHAAGLLQQSLSLGISGNLSGFLAKLRRRDPKLADTTAQTLLSRLRDSTVSPLVLLNLGSFVFSSQTKNSSLINTYFDALSTRLHLCVRTGIAVDEFDDCKSAVRFAITRAAGQPRWETEFSGIESEFGALESRRADTRPAPITKRLERPNVMASAGENTLELREEAKRVESLTGPENRDPEYAKLAAAAALKGDLSLSEALLSSIDNETVRRKASFSVYGPFVRRAAGDDDWEQAKTLALKVSHSLGRSLIVDWLGRSMAKVPKFKEDTKVFYEAGVAAAQRDSPTLEASAGLLVLAKSLLPVDKQSGLAAIRAAVFSLNRVPPTRPFSHTMDIPAETGSWMGQPSAMLRASDLLDVSELLSATFQELAKLDASEAQNLTAGLWNRAFSATAQLGVAKQMLEEAKDLKTRPKKGA